MATMNVMYAAAGARGAFGSVEVYAPPMAAANVTTSGTAASSAVTSEPLFARIKAIGGDMYVKPIPNGGTAVEAGTGAHLSDGEVIDFALPAGWVISVIDAA